MTLSFVSTPIGNRDDITLRAIETLKNVDFIICEDTRRTGHFLTHLEISKPLKSFHAQSSEIKAITIVEELLKSGKTAAYVSDAGTPCISDPGYVLVREALKQGLEIQTIPGVSAFLTLLPISGLRVDQFEFGGFLPHKKGRQTRIKEMKESSKTTIFYESVHRIKKLIKELNEHIEPTRKIVIGRELTKKFESIFRGTIHEAFEYLENKDNQKGEFVVMVEGKS